MCMCVCVFNANPLHCYALRVPRKADRWHYVWSIFESRTAWAGHITCWKSTLYSVLENVEVRVTVSVVLLLCCVG